MDQLFALGSNGSGQLGLGHYEDVSVPKQIYDSPCFDNDSITHVAAGGNHTILITATGNAYCSGDAGDGRCGTVTNNDGEGNLPTFRKLKLSHSTATTPIIAFAACTWDSTILAIRDEEGRATRIYVCGSASPYSKESLDRVALIPDFPPVGTAIVNLAAGFRHVVAVLDNGDVYGWGASGKGQLGEIDGTPNAPKFIEEPRKVMDIPFKVARAVCCQYTTCLIAEPGDGRIVILGADKWGLKSRAPVEIPSWQAITAGWGAIYVLKRDGTLLAWGRNDHGQLPPPGLPHISQVVAGSEHVIALTESGEALAWGWGEHGNCGPNVEKKSGNVEGRWNVLASPKTLPEDSRVTAVGAGCATSWINVTTEGVYL
ncbi:RCC1/BLIP-II [Xylariaceae sp. FL1019]|nr:RCC1/BLIP-II [Xylariaceae sp. FL1019]